MFRNNHIVSKSQIRVDKRKEKRPGGGEPDYEEVGPQRNKVEKNDRDSVRLCELCGSVEAAVRCEKCNGQAFCFSCDDMYHRHPKRSTHSRKALHSLPKDEKAVRPPLPPKDGQVAAPPQPPPRRHKRPSFLPSSSSNRKEDNEESGKSIMGSLRRFMGTRPLPAPPDQSNGDCSRKSQYLSSMSGLTRSKTAPTALSENNLYNQSLAVAIPQSIMELNKKGVPKPAASMPPTPISSHSKYPHLQPRNPVPARDRKLSLQQFPPSFDEKRASMMEVPLMNQTWGKHPAGIGVAGKGRSQSISNEQWNQLIEMRSANPTTSGISGNVSNTDLATIPPHHPGFVPTVGHGRNMGIAGRGMVSSASVCDLNTLAQQQQRSYPNMPSANSFQQLSLMNYDGGNMMWVPSCALCPPPPMYPLSMGSGGMKRTTSNISMNMSSVGSDITGYPWANNPHVHHMPPMYPPGYYPGCHQHMMPHMSMQGSAMSIPDSTRSFSRMPPSPATSIRSNSHRSHKSSKARSYCGGDPGGRKSRNRSRRRSDSDDSGSSSLSENEQVQIPISRPTVKSGLAWQCDHCTFINPGHALTCGMCSKTLTKNNESHNRRGSDRRKNGSRRKTDQEENISDYENDKRTRKRNGRESRNEHRPKGSGSLKGSAKPPRNKSRQKDSLSRSPSLSGSNEDEGSKLERQLKDLRISSRSRAGDYDRLSMTSRAKESGSLKREGGSRYKNRRRFNSERSRTPARSSPSRRSRRTSINSNEGASPLHLSPSSDYIPAEQRSSHDGTLIAGTASESRTIKAGKSFEVKNYSKYLGKKTKSSESNSGSESPQEDDDDDDGDEDEEAPEENEEDQEVFERKSESPKTQEQSKDEKIYAKKIRAKIGQPEENNIYEVHNNFRVEAEEPPSFANTLDGIETLKTNEVADADPNSQAIEDRPSSSEVHLPELDDIIPVLNYKLPENNFIYEDGKKEIIAEQKEVKVENGLMVDNMEIVDINMVSTLPLIINVVSPPAKPTVRKEEELSYETIEEERKDAKNEVAVNKGVNRDTFQKLLFAKEKLLSASEENALQVSNSTNEERILEEVNMSSSLESLNDILPGQRFTPLSFSSSEALFYSPPDSPELTVSEKHRRRMNQAAPQVEDDLVTALETINSSERDLKSSRETIRSSVEQLPYTEEKFEDAKGSSRHSIEKSSSATLSPVTPDERAAGVTVPNLKDLIHIPSEPRHLKRSSSEQMLSSNAQQRLEPKKKETILNPPLKDRPRRVPSIVMTEDEDEIDEKFLTVKELIARRRQKAMKKQGLELVQLLRDAEDYGYNPEEVSVALSLSGDKGPIEWLEDNWGHMVNTVKALASNYGQDKNVNDIGKISLFEAKKALRAHKGNIWAAVTECVEERRKNFSEIYSKGNFSRADIIKALEAHNGDSEEAFIELNKTRQLGSSFFKKIWAPAEEAIHSVSTLFRRDSKSKIMISAEIPSSPEDDHMALKRKPNDNYNPSKNENDYANVEIETKQESENVGGIYANVVTPLLRKIEETLQKANTKVPALSEDLKRKIVRAIIEGDPDAPNATFNFDSDDESTIEELLAVAENPTFYEYFTAVDLEDDYEDESADDEDDEDVDYEEESANESSFNETQDNITDQEDEQLLGVEVTSEFEYKDDYKSTENESKILANQKEAVQVIGNDENESKILANQKEAVQVIGNDDVGALPLYPPQKETNSSILRKVPLENESLVEVKGSSVSNAPNIVTIKDSISNVPKSSYAVLSSATKDDSFALTPLAPKKDTTLDANKVKLKKLPKANTANKVDKTKKKILIKTNRKGSQKKNLEEVKETASEREEEIEQIAEGTFEQLEEEDSDAIGSFTKEEGPESGDEESMSVTTGRLSLSVRQTGDKKANIDVKSQTIQTDMVSLPHHTGEAAPSNEIKAIGTKGDSTVLNMSEKASPESYTQPETENEPEEIIIRKSPMEMLDADEAAKVRAHGGPVTVQKATQIVGKAIAKAMARESSVRRDSYSSDESSQVEIPPSPASPPSTPDPEETPGKLESIEPTDSEDELQRSLDTIPEEEEASERTASGRIITRSAKTDSGYQKVSKAIYIPPAVASFSGPIFIPSAPSASTAAVGNGGASTHSYYNVPKETPSGGASEVKKDNQTQVKQPVNTDYESLSQEKDYSKPTTSKSVAATSSGGPLTTEEAKKQSADDPSVKLSSTNKTKSTIIVKNNSNLKLVSKIYIPSKFNQSAVKEEPSDSSKPRNEAAEPQEKPPIDQTIPEVKLKKVGKIIKSAKNEEKSSDSSSQSTVDSSSLVRKSPAASPSRRLQQTKRRSTIDSSGESEDEEDLAAAAQRVNLINEQQKRSPQSLMLKMEKGANRNQRGNIDYEDEKKLRRQESPINLHSTDLDTNEDLLQDHPEPPIVVIHLQTDEEDEDEDEKSVTITDFEKDHEYEQLRFDRTVRRLLAEGQATSYEKAELAARLLTFSFDETDSIQAAEGCSSLYSALQFLQQECELCASKFPMGRMVSMLYCVHRCCYDCANNYFSFQIKTKNIRELRCPFCNEPDLEKNEETAAEYLNNMDILLKNILDEETHELFQRKLRDWTLMKDPNFKWCNKCSSGFIANPRARKLICPDCKDVACAQCRKPWELQHEGISCEDFTKWKEENDPEHQAEGVDKHLAECGITCPNCRFTYALAKGGCMHFTCTECKYEFCSGCNKPFKQGAKCTVGPYCERLGLHAHHPRNCLFYLRDKEPGQLQQLLKEHNIYFNVDSPKEDASVSGRIVCSVQEQKETTEGLRDEMCGRAALEGNAGLCRQHYVEYLGELVHYNGIDPIQDSDEEDLRYILRRDNIQVPRRIPGELDFVFRQRLRKLIKEQLPLC